MRTPSAKTKSAPLDMVITETLKLWRKYHLTYDQNMGEAGLREYFP
jgi:hypothetical protein